MNYRTALTLDERIRILHPLLDWFDEVIETLEDEEGEERNRVGWRRSS